MTLGLFIARSGDLAAIRGHLSITNENNQVMDIDIVIPKYHDLYLNSIPFDEGRYYLGIGNKFFFRKEAFNTIDFNEWYPEKSLDSIRKGEMVTARDIEPLTKKKYRTLSEEEYFFKVLDKE